MSTVLLDNVSYMTYYDKYLSKNYLSYKAYLFSAFDCNDNCQRKLQLYNYFFSINFKCVDWNSTELIIASIVMKDLLHLVSAWRTIKGYPTSGQKTRSNAKHCRKNKLLATFRLNQFFSIFGHKKRNIFPTLIIGEYTNRLWYYNWNDEWIQARIFILRLVKSKTNSVPFDPVRLAKNFTNGYTRVGQASKLGKSKKITNVATIGMPLFFSRWLYFSNTPAFFPFRIWISDEDRRKMGKKSKKNLKKVKKKK